MGSAARHRPKRLAEKLRDIRLKIDGGVSQNELIRRLGLEGEIEQERISKYERGILEPPLYILCAYSDLAEIPLEVLAKDNLELPNRIPAKSSTNKK